MIRVPANVAMTGENDQGTADQRLLEHHPTFDFLLSPDDLYPFDNQMLSSKAEYGSDPDDLACSRPKSNSSSPRRGSTGPVSYYLTQVGAWDNESTKFDGNSQLDAEDFASKNSEEAKSISHGHHQALGE